MCMYLTSLWMFTNVSEIVTMSQVECLRDGFSQFATCSFSTYSLHLTVLYRNHNLTKKFTLKIITTENGSALQTAIDTFYMKSNL